MWIYKAPLWGVLLMVTLILQGAALAAYWIGAKYRERHPNTDVGAATEFIPSTILGILALMIGFTFSLASGRYEHRRQLVVDEANELTTSYERAWLIKSDERKEIIRLLRVYVDERINQYQEPFFSERFRELEARLSSIENQIWTSVRRAVHENGAIFENALVASLDDLFDLRMSRNFALIKTLPQAVYWAIILIAVAGVGTYNFNRGLRKNQGPGAAGTLALLLSIILVMIVDLDRPTSGAIRISQDALIAARESINRE